jgi:hypothetical protein
MHLLFPPLFLGFEQHKAYKESEQDMYFQTVGHFSHCNRVNCSVDANFIFLFAPDTSDCKDRNSFPKRACLIANSGHLCIEPAYVLTFFLSFFLALHCFLLHRSVSALYSNKSGCNDPLSVFLLLHFFACFLCIVVKIHI